MKFFYLYVLQSEKTGYLYIGLTSDLRRRLGEHQSDRARATSKRGPWELIYYEAYRSKQDAEGREKYLKSGSGHRFLDKQLRMHFSENPRACP